MLGAPCCMVQTSILDLETVIFSEATEIYPDYRNTTEGYYEELHAYPIVVTPSV